MAGAKGDSSEAASLTPSQDVSQSRQAQVRTEIVPHLSVAERAALGKAARGRIGRRAHAGWSPTENRADPVALLEAQAVSRVPELVPIRYGRMLVSPFSFYRGAAVIMAADLATMPNSGLTVQLCGDAHIANFGGFASPERDLILDVNDFDETLPGPWEWDVKRLAVSIEIAGRERGFAPDLREELVRGAVGEYQQAMTEFAALDNLDLWYLHVDRAGIRKRWGGKGKNSDTKHIEASFARAHKRDNVRAFHKLTHRVDGQLRISSDPPLLVPIEDLLTDEEQGRLEETIRKFIRKYRVTLEPDRRRLLESYRYVHMARKVVGVGSVGTRTWVVLMLGRDDDDPLFLQVKEAQESVLAPYLGQSKYKNQGQRVVAGQRLMQSSSDIFLGWEQIQEGMDREPHHFYIRQLWDWKLSPDIDIMPPAELMVYSKMCAWTLARAHARAGDRIAIAAYLGKNATFAKALVRFAAAYADQNELDYQALAAAEGSGRISVQRGI